MFTLSLIFPATLEFVFVVAKDCLEETPKPFTVEVAVVADVTRLIEFDCATPDEIDTLEPIECCILRVLPLATEVAVALATVADT